MLTVIVTIMIIRGGGLYVVLTVVVTIRGMYVCSVHSYFDNNGEVYMQ